jgi:hypothetical protein
MPYSPKTWVLGNPITDTDLNRIETGIDDVTDDFEAHIADDTGWVTTGITAATDWSITSQAYRRIGSVVYLRLKVKRTGSDLIVNEGGILPGTQTVAVLPAAIRAVTTQGVGSMDGALASFSVATNVVLKAVSDPTPLSTNVELQAAGTYFLG